MIAFSTSYSGFFLLFFSLLGFNAASLNLKMHLFSVPAVVRDMHFSSYPLLTTMLTKTLHSDRKIVGYNSCSESSLGGGGGFAV